MNIAIILAGGMGERMGNMNIPKQFVDVYGKPIIIHTLEKFDLHEEIEKIIVVCKREYIDDIKIMIRKFGIDKVKAVVAGGETRQESTFNGLFFIKEEVKPSDIVILHDAVRPFITNRIITDNIEGAKKYGAVDTVIQSADTVIQSEDGEYITNVPRRSEVYLGQTPQSFQFDIIYNAHVESKKNKVENATDDCQLILKNGGRVALIEGDKLNFKITTQEDLTMLKALVKLGKLERI